MSNKNKHLVNFTRGTTTFWENLLQNTPEKIDNDTLYFIYDDAETSTFGKLYLGQKLICEKIDLSNYYNKEEVNNLISSINNIFFKIVQEKPTENIQTNVIYLIPSNNQNDENIYEEWIYINNSWELIGSIKINLTDYALQSEIPIKISDLENDLILFEPPYVKATVKTYEVNNQLFYYNGDFYKYIGRTFQQSIGGYYNNFIRLGGTKCFSIGAGMTVANQLPTNKSSSTVSQIQPGDLYAVGTNNTMNSEGAIQQLFICTGVTFQNEASNSNIVKYWYSWREILPPKKITFQKENSYNEEYYCYDYSKKLTWSALFNYYENNYPIFITIFSYDNQNGVTNYKTVQLDLLFEYQNNKDTLTSITIFNHFLRQQKIIITNKNDLACLYMSNFNNNE